MFRILSGWIILSSLFAGTLLRAEAEQPPDQTVAIVETRLKVAPPLPEGATLLFEKEYRWLFMKYLLRVASMPRSTYQEAQKSGWAEVRSIEQIYTLARISDDNGYGVEVNGTLTTRFAWTKRFDPSEISTRHERALQLLDAPFVYTEKNHAKEHRQIFSKNQRREPIFERGFKGVFTVVLSARTASKEHTILWQSRRSGYLPSYISTKDLGYYSWLPNDLTCTGKVHELGIEPSSDEPPLAANE